MVHDPFLYEQPPMNDFFLPLILKGGQIAGPDRAHPAL
jgi:hypothetical protein